MKEPEPKLSKQYIEVVRLTDPNVIEVLWTNKDQQTSEIPEEYKTDPKVIILAVIERGGQVARRIPLNVSAQLVNSQGSNATSGDT